MFKLCYLLSAVFFVLANGDEQVEHTLMSAGEPRIVGGTLATFPEASHQVSLRYTPDSNFGVSHFCGGSLIRADLVLTAAHCIAQSSGTLKPAEFRIVIGTINRLNQTTATQIRTVSKVTVHAQFNKNTLQNDIALVKLSSNITSFGTEVGIIGRPISAIAVNTTCRVSGWGTVSSGGLSSANLLIASVNLFDPMRCNASDSYGYFGNAYMQPGMMCAGLWEGGVDACQGDSGGPLTCNGVLAGVVSWGNECALARFPGIYTDVYYYRDWIAANHSVAVGPVSFLAILLLAVMVKFI